MKFTVTYHECYSGEYEVEANSKEEAEELVKEDIFNGRRPTPNECYDSFATLICVDNKKTAVWSFVFTPYSSLTVLSTV